VINSMDVKNRESFHAENLDHHMLRKGSWISPVTSWNWDKGVLVCNVLFVRLLSCNIP